MVSGRGGTLWRVSARGSAGGGSVNLSGATPNRGGPPGSPGFDPGRALRHPVVAIFEAGASAADRSDGSGGILADRGIPRPGQ